MRLRLTVQRNGIPAANVLWNVPETNSSQAYTITRLLEDVNHVIPLEAEQWGLEHYVVEVGGFECLHFSPVAQSLKDDDHVFIRPLMTAEVRARTLTGRTQVSEDGRHLVDGVPFGRPYLRHPNRPAVRIPPRKRQRLDDAEDEPEIAGLLTGSGEAAVLGEGVDHSIVRQRSSHKHTTAGSGEPSARARRTSKRVRFQAPALELDNDDDDDDSDEDDDDFAPGGEEAGDAETEDDSDDSDDSDDTSDDSSDPDSDGVPESAAKPTIPSDSSSDSDSDDTSSDSDASSPPEVRSSKGVLATPNQRPLSSPEHVVPGHGRSDTRSRNSRRTRTNRLRHLKVAGKLPQDADLKALDEYEATRSEHMLSEHEPSHPFSTHEGKRKRVDDDGLMADISDSDGAEDAARRYRQRNTDRVSVNTTDSEEEVTELAQRKRELMARFGEDETNTSEPSQAPAVVPKPASPQVAEEEETPAPKDTPKRRLRPDTAAISRILTRQAMPSKKKPTKKPVEVTSEPEDASDPDFWKSKINLSAFECWEEEFELTAPPYPFKQHWDPASKLMREKNESKRQKRKGKKQREPTPVEEEEEEEEKIFLDYDDTGATEDPEAKISAAIEDQLLQDVATAAQSDLPPLPEDVSALPALTSNDIKQGAIIVCKFFSVNPITITPEISDYKTAVVDREGDSGGAAGTIRLKIAARDLPRREKKFDNRGNRVYDAADQFYMEEDEEDEGLWEGQYGELLEPKLLQAA